MLLSWSYVSHPRLNFIGDESLITLLCFLPGDLIKLLFFLVIGVGSLNLSLDEFSAVFKLVIPLVVESSPFEMLDDFLLALGGFDVEFVIFFLNY